MNLAIRFRAFVPSDLGPVVALWNRCLTHDPITEERFWRLFLLDANLDIEGARIAVDASGNIVGFLHVICRREPLGSTGLQPELGWLTAFFVAPERRREGIASALLQQGVAFLQARGRTRMMCSGYAPYYIFPGVDEAYPGANAFLAARHFVAGPEAVAMGMTLEGIRMPEAVARTRQHVGANGINVRLFERADTLPLFQFVEEHFPHWTPSLREGLLRGNEEILLAHQSDGQIVAYAQWQNPHNDPPDGAPGRFGPFGVHPDYRSQGLGAVVFYALIERVAGNGARYLWFGWAGGRNIGFYERAGCRITRRFQIYSRAL